MYFGQFYVWINEFKIANLNIFFIYKRKINLKVKLNL